MNKRFYTTKLSNIADVIQGQSPESEFYSKFDGVPFLQGNRTFGNLYPSFDTFTHKVTKIANKGDVLMSVRAPVGALNYAPCDLCIGRGLASIRAKDGNNQFVYYALKYNVNNLIKQGSATTFDSVNKDIINDFELIIPENKIERNTIAKVLSSLDSKIELNNRINRELESMAKTLYDYWFVQFDFPDANGNPYKSSGGKMAWNEELKREIPEGWEVKKLGELVYQVTDSISPDEYPELPYLPIDKLPMKQLYYYEYENRSEANSSLIRFKENDILLGAMRVYFHRVCNAISDGISRSTIIVLRPFKANIKNFTLFTLNKNETIEFATNNSTGTSIPYAKWNDSLENYLICIPNADNILVLFNKIIDPILENFKIQSNQIQQLSELRDWLLPMLMNGQVSVKGG